MTTNKAAKFVAYARVSTTEQGADGLGIDAQTHAIRQHVESVGGVLVREFVEVASGDDDARPKLQAALKLAKQTGATVIVSRLDRLSRVVAKIAGLIRQGTELRVLECANASTLEIHIRAVIAEEERRKIAERTKDALEAAKRRGVKLGSARPGHWTGREDRRAAGQRAASEASAAAFRELRADTYAIVVPIAKRMHAAGHSLNAIARHLNAENIRTQRGSSWRPVQVKRVLEAAR